MGDDLSVVLFVEGSEGPPNPRRSDPLVSIWQEVLVSELGLHEIERVVSISKRNLVAMVPEFSQMAGRAIPFDELMARELEHMPFDAAVVAWDILPPWSNLPLDRWTETLLLHEGLARSEVLPLPWRTTAERRLDELVSRPCPGARRGPPRLGRHTVLALCMEPTFEALILECEAAVRAALGVSRRRTPRWPTWWSPGDPRRPEDVLQAAILAAESLDPRPNAFRKVRGDMRTAKNDWGLFLLRRLLDDARCRPRLEAHPIAVRAREVLDR
jgi:hypothetical protein